MPIDSRKIAIATTGFCTFLHLYSPQPLLPELAREFGVGPAQMSAVMTASTAAIALTAVRGRAMAAACAQTPTAMSAVLGGDPDEVLGAIKGHGLTPANMNGGGQIVAAGAPSSSPIRNPPGSTVAKQAASARPGFHPSAAAQSAASAISSGRMARMFRRSIG